MKSALITSVALLSPLAAQAQDLIQWTNTSISGLYGGGFKVTGNNQSTFTFEHANGWKYGDMFMFVDVAAQHDNPNADTSWYGEFNPRFSLGKMGAFSMPESSVVSDFSIATSYERGKGGVESLLLGVGSDWKIPGFAFFNVNLYARKDTSKDAGFDDAQLTLVWNKPFTIGEENFVIDGFMDYVFGWGPQNSNVHFVPQIKWDIGKFFNLDAQRLYFGTEVDIWTNKFGIDSSTAFKTNQFAVNALVKFHF